MTEKQRIPLDLYLHDDTEKGLLLSRDGKRANARWFPRRFVTVPQATRLVKPEGYAVQSGVFKVEEWMLRRIDWINTSDENQMGLGL